MSIDAQGAEQVSNWWYNTVDYGSPVFRARMKQFLTEAAARYNDDPRVAGIRVVTGFQGETQPVKKDKNDIGSEQALIASHENLIPCDQYQKLRARDYGARIQRFHQETHLSDGGARALRRLFRTEMAL